MITLKTVLRANAASCSIFASLFILNPIQVTVFLGGNAPAPEPVLLALAGVLMLNGVHLLWASFKPMPSKLLVMYFSLGDFGWFIGTVCLVLLGVWVTTAPGVIAAMLVAVVVGLLGVLQMTRRKKMGDC
ncbi:MAG: hypothetical protein JKX83_05015 [Pseudomonadales bacterium]|nr:hypothetical protein [Pseudomonadales bacterium]